MRPRLPATALSLILLASGLAACGGGGSDDDPSSTPTSASAPQADALPAAVTDLMCDAVLAADGAVRDAVAEDVLLEHMHELGGLAEEVAALEIDGLADDRRQQIRAHLNGASAEIGVVIAGGTPPTAVGERTSLEQLVDDCSS